MGIQGLLTPFLKSIQRPAHIKEWEGKTIAIDTYSWLHKAACGCAQELCLGTRTTRHIDYVMSRVNLLRHYGVVPYVVFDGAALPGKKGTEDIRQKRREHHFTLAKNLLAEGKKEEAREAFVKAADITPQLAHDVILSLKEAGVKYVVAPYEADAQLRFLERNGDVEGIITEDSDLLVYGAKNVLFKLDQFGHCIHICREDFGKVADAQMSLWTDTEFRQMAILSGCDYLPNVPGLGLKKAYQLVRTYKSAEKAIKAMRLQGNWKVPLGYEKLFRRAEFTFLYQIVYNPTTKKLVHLHPLPTPPPPPEDLMDCGELWEEEMAVAVAEGRMDPLSKITFKPSINVLPASSPRRQTQKPRGSQSSTPVPKNQRTLNSFVLISSPAVKRENYSTSSPSQSVSHPAKTLNTSSTSSSSQSQELASKFSNKKPKAPKETSILSPSVGNVIQQMVPIEELIPEDAEPLSQEAWSELSETGGSEDMGPDLPSSQLQAENLGFSLGKVLPNLATSSQSVSEASPLTSPVGKYVSGCLRFSDGVVSPPVPHEESRTKAALKSRTLLRKSGPSSMLLNSSPPTCKTLSTSSDSVLKTEDEILIDKLNLPPLKRPHHRTETPSTLKKQRTKPVVQESTELEQEMSPSLARVASGIRQRFMFKGPNTPLRRQNNDLGNRKSSSSSFTPSKSVGASGLRMEQVVTPTCTTVVKRRHTDIGPTSRYLGDGESLCLEGTEPDENASPAAAVVSTPKLAAFFLEGAAILKGMLS